MATIDEHLKYLKESERFPKINKKQITDPKSQFSGVEYNRIVDALEEVGISANEAKTLVKDFLKQNVSVIEQPITLVTDEAYDILESIGGALEDGIYFTYDSEVEEENSTIDENGVLTIGGTLSDGVLTINGTLADGILTI